MTELLSGPAQVREAAGAADVPEAVYTDAGWRRVERVAARWLVETDWWCQPMRREYLRCLLAGGDCCELYRDLQEGGWYWARRYD